MDFGALPPEVNSGRMYSGPGSGSMLAAAAAWDGLAAQLRSTAASYSAAVSGLTADWQGPSSAAMAGAAAPFAAWMNATATQAEQTAGQARAAVAAYETAFGAMAPPPVIAANRALLASLSATNIFAQNTAAIAATEAQYADMWATDAAAMYGYAAQSATAAQVPLFTAPPPTTQPGGLGAQSAALASSAAASAQPMTAVASALQSLAAPAAGEPASLQTLLTSLLPEVIGLELFESLGADTVYARMGLVSSTFGFGLAARGFQTGELAVPLIPGVLYPPAANLDAAAPAVSAGLGEAGTVGALSVPPSWAAATPAVRLAAAVLQGAGPAGLPLVATVGQGNVFGQMALGSIAGGALGNAVPRRAAASGARVAAAEHDDGNDKTSDKLKRVLAELSQQPETVQHWHTDKAHLEGLLEQLSQKPGVHAVHVSSRERPDPVPHQPRWG
ncbi:PPE family protein [Candidatus Mycobacterium methanotrophicum]|uniref:PPE family protein n=1 Tax=Candidatus Mycobacterium methanotrophicum TaxID=2943498 RepID=A0ABY4QIX7_9MYCO|nr:PPE family protein [Candidatus Mycobacterium methanotrophicum]UQX09759.1 PPE family protein [Candidatus Mycobacterium methanotrophicum]